MRFVLLDERKKIKFLVFSPEIEKIIKDALCLQANESIFYVMVTNEQGQHTRQMRVLMHNTSPVKFEGFPTPFILSPKIGPANETSPAVSTRYMYVETKFNYIFRVTILPKKKNVVFHLRKIRLQ